MRTQNNNALETQQTPGLSCPQCGFRIQVSIQMLLSSQPIFCTGCGLKLTVDQEKSQGSLRALRKLYKEIQKAEEMRAAATPDNTA